ncbi:hypothetical protein E2320_020222, partial [Naja naja]
KYRASDWGRIWDLH